MPDSLWSHLLRSSKPWKLAVLSGGGEDQHALRPWQGQGDMPIRRPAYALRPWQGQACPGRRAYRPRPKSTARPLARAGAKRVSDRATCLQHTSLSVPLSLALALSVSLFLDVFLCIFILLMISRLFISLHEHLQSQVKHN